MGHEAEAALDAGLAPLLWNPNEVAVPAGMRCYAENPLPLGLSEALGQLDSLKASPPPLVDRHVSRLSRFLKRQPFCPVWSGILMADDIRVSGPFDSLVAPREYAERFRLLLTSRPWVNLHAVGILKGQLVVSVVAPAAASGARIASVQLSGPDARVRANPGWQLPFNVSA
jgi:hypothetical protein